MTTNTTTLTDAGQKLATVDEKAQAESFGRSCVGKPGDRQTFEDTAAASLLPALEGDASLREALKAEIVKHLDETWDALSELWNSHCKDDTAYGVVTDACNGVEAIRAALARPQPEAKGPVAAGVEPEVEMDTNVVAGIMEHVRHYGVSEKDPRRRYTECQLDLGIHLAFKAALASTTPPAEAKTPDAGVGEPRERWGIEETADAIWVGPMRPNSVKVDRVVFWKSTEGVTEKAKRRNMDDALLVVRGVNAALTPTGSAGEDDTGVREALAPFADCCHNHFHDRSVLDQFEDDESVLCLIRSGKLSPTGISVGHLRRATAALAPQPPKAETPAGAGVDLREAAEAATEGFAGLETLLAAQDADIPDAEPLWVKVSGRRQEIATYGQLRALHRALTLASTTPPAEAKTPDAVTGDEDEPETDLTRLDRIERQMLEHGGVDSDDMEWMAAMTRTAIASDAPGRSVGDGGLREVYAHLPLAVSEPHDRRQPSGSILITDAANNDIAEFYHRDHATVGQSYEVALALANRLVSAASSDQGRDAPVGEDDTGVRGAWDDETRIAVNTDAEARIAKIEREQPFAVSKHLSTVVSHVHGIYDLTTDPRILERAVALKACAVDAVEAALSTAPAARPGDEVEADKDRLDWLEQAARKSRSGISFDHIPSVDGERSGFRFMRKFFIGDARDTLRSAIDAARGEVEQIQRRELAAAPAADGGRG